jgi:hypothetical protein
LCTSFEFAPALPYRQVLRKYDHSYLIHTTSEVTSIALQYSNHIPPSSKNTSAKPLALTFFISDTYYTMFPSAMSVMKELLLKAILCAAVSLLECFLYVHFIRVGLLVTEIIVSDINIDELLCDSSNLSVLFM